MPEKGAFVGKRLVMIVWLVPISIWWPSGLQRLDNLGLGRVPLPALVSRVRPISPSGTGSPAAAPDATVGAQEECRVGGNIFLL